MPRKSTISQASANLSPATKFLTGLELILDSMESNISDVSYIMNTNEVTKFKKMLKNGRKTLIELEKSRLKKVRISTTNRKYYQKVKKRKGTEVKQSEGITSSIIKVLSFA